MRVCVCVCVCVSETEGDGQNLCFSGSVSPPSVHTDITLVSNLKCSFPLKTFSLRFYLVMARKAKE